MRPITLQTGKTTGDFDALLASRQLNYAEAFTARLTSQQFAGINLAYTTAQKAFTVPPCDGSLMLQTYVANDVLIEGMRFKCSSGGENQGGDPTTSITVDEQQITLTPNGNTAVPTEINGIPFLQAVGMGAFDAAVIQRDRWFFDANWNPVGGMPIFYGFAASIDNLGRTQVVMKVKSDLVLLNIMMPCNLYQPNCQYTVYSGGCGADKSAFTVHDVVGASPTKSFIPWTSSTTQFTSGDIFFESGPNTNITRTIRKADTTGLWLAYPLPFLPLAGDDFAAAPGCNRLDPLLNPSTSGCVFFSRQRAFRATPHVPNAEMAI